MRYSIYEMQRQGFRIRLDDYKETHSRFFPRTSAAEKFTSISYSIFCWSFYSRLPFIRKSKVLKHGIIFTVFPRRELSTTRRFLLHCSCISRASLKLYLLIDSLPIYQTVLYESPTKFIIIY